MTASYAFIFPGQGSQSIGMLADLAATEPKVAQTFAEASEVLGYDLWQLVQTDPEEQLGQTEVTQPALLAASVAVYRSLQPATGPAYLAGHSLGEYSALVCAGALSFADAVRLVQLRGQAMQRAVPAGTGAMAAVLGLADEDVAKACASAAAGDVVDPVNFNAPGQVVIAGHTEAVERASKACKEAGAKRVMPLPVSVPSHCSLMKPAAAELADALAEVQLEVPSIPVVHNVNVAVGRDPAEIRSLLCEQLYSPVRWTETIQWLAGQGVSDLYETGPGKVLCGLSKKIDRQLQAQPLHTAAQVAAFNEQ